MDIPQLNLGEKIIIMDYDSQEELDTDWEILKNNEHPNTYFLGEWYKAVLKGEDISEDSLGDLGIVDANYGLRVNNFIEAVEAIGFHWLQNPVRPFSIEDFDRHKAQVDLEYQRAEKKTLRHPLIFIKVK